MCVTRIIYSVDQTLKTLSRAHREAAKEVARIIYSVHDDVKDKEFELELSWICQESGNRHQLVPKVDDDDDDDDDDS